MLQESDFICTTYSKIENETFECSAPSNIALVKYWGKKKNQIPANPSISFTLKNCQTITKIEAQLLKDPVQDTFSFDFYFEGKPKSDFKPKIQTFFERIKTYCPYLLEYHFIIDSKNTFPHSSGIASSASGMAALAFNIMQLEKKINPTLTDELFYKKASFLARLGSGSACRSIKGEIVAWGAHSEIKNSSYLYGVETTNIHTIFKTFQDTILLIDKGEKKVSSTVGHDLMNNHPFAQLRFEQAFSNLSTLSQILQNGTIEEFIKIVESEALTLHAMMMTSSPYFLLMKPNTLEAINRIWAFREQTQTPVCFTLDAGANIHVLYPFSYKEKVLHFIKSELVDLCQNQQYICDEIGTGAKSI